MVDRISHSQLQTWDRCKFSWHLNYEQGWTQKEKSNALTIGTLVHEFLEIYYANVKLGTVAEAWPAIRTRVNSKMQNPMQSLDDIQCVNTAARLVEKYVHDFAPFQDKGLKIHEVEYHFVIPLISPKGRDFELQGYVDLLLEMNGKYWIWDHKTANGKFWTPTECMMDSQMPTYAAALRTQGIDVFGIVINMLNTYQYKKWSEVTPEKLFRREKTYRTPAELDNILVEIGRSYDEMKDFQESGMPARRSLKKDCSFCFFQDPCLMGIKGVDLNEYMSLNYRKKGEPLIEVPEDYEEPSKFSLNIL